MKISEQGSEREQDDCVGVMKTLEEEEKEEEDDKSKEEDGDKDEEDEKEEEVMEKEHKGEKSNMDSQDSSTTTPSETLADRLLSALRTAHINPCVTASVSEHEDDNEEEKEREELKNQRRRLELTMHQLCAARGSLLAAQRSLTVALTRFPDNSLKGK